MRYRLLSLSLLCAAVAAAAIVFFQTESSDPEPVNRTSIPGDAVFSKERLGWEVRRLRDPATGRIPRGIRTRELAHAATIPERIDSRKGAGLLDYAWQHRGPWNIGGRTRAVAVDITNENIVLAGGVSGAIWRSTDGGATWAKADIPKELNGVTTLVQDRRPGKTSVWYCGTGELYGASASGNGAYFYGTGLYKSTDNGVSWRALTYTSANKIHSFDNIFDLSWRLATDPSNLEQDVVYAAVYGTVSRSTNGGQTWQTVVGGPNSFGQTSGYFTDVAVDESGTVYATISGDGHARGIWRSDSNGAFNRITPDDWPRSTRRTVIGLSKSNPNVVYFLAETPGVGTMGTNFRGDSLWHSLWKYTYVSGNGAGEGGTWENRSMNIPQYGGRNGDFNSQSSYDLVVAVKPDDEDVVFLGGTNVIRSTDGFATDQNAAWVGGFKNKERDSSAIEDYLYPNHHPDLHEFTFSYADPNILYTGSDGGVHRTSDCLADSISWTDIGRGYLTTQFYTVAIDHGSPGDPTLVGGLQDNGTWLSASNDPQVFWQEFGTSDGAYCAIADGGESVYVSKQLGRIYRITTENGQFADETRIDPPGPTSDDYLFINPFVLDPVDNRRMYLPIGRELWVNTDLSLIPMGRRSSSPEGWVKLEQTRVDSGTVISSVAASLEPAHQLYYGTADGRVFRLDATTTTADPVEVTGSEFPAGYVNCISIDPRDVNHVLVVFSNYSVQSIFETTDGGQSWRAVSGNLEQNPTGTGDGPSVRWVEILHRPNGTLYLAGTSTGLYSTSRLDGIYTGWEQEGAATIGNAVVDMIEARQSDGFVAVATHGHGMYSSTIATLSVDNDVATPGSLAVGRIHPNPVRDRATVSIVVPRAATLTAALYDGRGRRVRALLDAPRPAGEHQLEIDASGLPSGAYTLEIRAGQLQASRQLRIIR